MPTFVASARLCSKMDLLVSEEKRRGSAWLSRMGEHECVTRKCKRRCLVHLHYDGKANTRCYESE
jgi:hypothetical protein